MSDINSIILVGRLTRDMELTYLPTGTAIGKFSLAVNRRIKKNGEWQGEANFFDVVLWGKSAEALKAYLVKGKQVCVSGELHQQRWTDQEGKTRSRVGIEATTVQLLGGNAPGSTAVGNPSDDFESDPPF